MYSLKYAHTTIQAPLATNHLIVAADDVIGFVIEGHSHQVVPHFDASIFCTAGVYAARLARFVTKTPCLASKLPETSLAKLAEACHVVYHAACMLSNKFLCVCACF